jgi:ubiquinone biosynthesis protein
MQKVLRYFTILAVTVTFYIKAFICIRGNGDDIDKRRSVLLRLAIEKLGSVFVKFGQYIAVQPIYIPVSYTSELFLLLEDVPSFPYPEVERIIEEDFGKKPAELFSSFNNEPFAAASFGQVHEAILKTGEKVAVKIQRPHIFALVKEDISLMKWVGHIIDLLPLGPNKIIPLIDEFERWTHNELNYTIEALANKEYYDISHDNPEQITAPNIYLNFCSKRVLTTEFIEGITLSKIILAYRESNREVIEKIEEWGFKKKDVVLFILKDFMRQMYLKGFFHADPHPANIIFAKDNRIVFIDFGIFGRFSKKKRLIFMRYARSFWWNDTDNAFESLTEMCDMSHVQDMNTFKNDFIELSNKVHDRVKERLKGTYREGYSVQEVMALLQKNKAIIPADTMLYFRSVLTLRNYASNLYPTIQEKELIDYMKIITLENFAMELPSLLSKKGARTFIRTLINIYEKNIMKYA